MSDRLVAFVERIEADPAHAPALLIDLYSDSAARAECARTPAATLDLLMARLGLVRGMAAKAKELRNNLRKEAIGMRLATEYDAPAEVREVIGWDLYPAGVLVPAGYSLTREAIHRRTADGLVRVGVPLLLTRRTVDYETREWAVELAWRDEERDRWQTRIVPRDVALDSRAMVRLAAHGLPVSSASAREVVAWLTALDQDPSTPTDWCAARCGWLGSEDQYYLLGRHVIAAEGTTHRVDISASAGGAQQLVDAIAARGTWEGWQATAAVAGGHPSAYLAIYLAVSAAILRPMRALNFGCDWAGRAGRGKTTSLRLGASVVGDPDRYRGSWAGTLPGIETHVAMLSDLPACIDEGSAVQPQDRASRGALLYSIIEGTGRSRGDVGRLQSRTVEHWRTVLLSTSEAGVTDWSAHQGLRERVLTLRGYPLGPDNGALADAIKDGCSEHYGHLLPRVVRWAVGADWVDLRARWGLIRDDLRGRATSTAAQRWAQHVATVTVAAWVVHSELSVPRPTLDPVAWMWDQVLATTGEGDRAEAAYRSVWAWCYSRAEHFQREHEQGQAQPHQGWLGIWHDEYVAIDPDQLRRHLDSLGHPAMRALVDEWAERGWLRFTGSRRPYFARRPPGTGKYSSVVQYIALRQMADDEG